MTTSAISVTLSDDLRGLFLEIRRQIIINVGKIDAEKVKDTDLELMIAVLSKLGIANDSVSRLLSEGLFEDLPNLLAECSRYSVMDYFVSFKIHQQQANILVTKLKHSQMVQEAVQAVIDIEPERFNKLFLKKAANSLEESDELVAMLA